MEGWLGPGRQRKSEYGERAEAEGNLVPQASRLQVSDSLVWPGVAAYLFSSRTPLFYFFSYWDREVGGVERWYHSCVCGLTPDLSVEGVCIPHTTTKPNWPRQWEQGQRLWCWQQDLRLKYNNGGVCLTVAMPTQEGWYYRRVSWEGAAARLNSHPLRSHT